MKHNIKPGLVPELVELLRTSKQTCKVLRDKEGSCYCVEGLLCELYRRHHPDSSGWFDSLFRVRVVLPDGRGGYRESGAGWCPPSVIEWATTNNRHPSIITDYPGEPDPIALWRLNDGMVLERVGQSDTLSFYPAWSFEDFIKALQEA